MKNLRLLSFFLCLAMLTACSSNSPRAVVTRFMDRLVDRDAEGAVEMLYINGDDTSVLSAYGKSALTQLVATAWQDDDNATGHIRSYKITNEEVDREAGKAVVTVRVTNTDGTHETTQIILRKNKQDKWRIVLTK